MATVHARIGWKNLTAAEYLPSGYPFLATPNIKNRDIDFSNVNYISRFRYDESPDLKLSVGDVLLTKDGFTLGTVNIVRNLPRPATVNGSIAVLRSFGIDPTFLYHVISSSPIQAHIWSVKDGMDVLHLFQRDIKRFPIPLPPLEEQRRIANFLDTKTALIDRLALLLRASLNLLESRIVGVIDDELAKVSDEAIALKYWASMVDTEHKTAPHVPEGGFWIAGTSAVRGGDIAHHALYETDEASYVEWTRRRRPRPGDVLLSREAPVGEVAVYRQTDPKIAIGQRMVLITPDSRLLEPEYLMWCLLSTEVKRFYDLKTQGSLHPHLNMSDIGSIPIKRGVLQRQREAVQRISSDIAATRRLRDSRTRMLGLLTERRQALITAAVTGQFDVSTASGRNVTEGVSA
ncbi:restriction endonuclease subunit S [Streptomyces nigra]|uniref:restriction endonuclease subunit S n=1 Tax=Streptomyces nigra TaxID=1827580 RepID=UPI0036265E8B